jgi:hypothetical protein
MRTSLFAVLIAMAIMLVAFDAVPRCTSVDPDIGKKGDLITAKGENLGKTGIAELYLTNGTKDTKVDISDQSDVELKFKIPEIPAGRYRLLILTANRASLVEQPVVVTVE